MEAKYTDADMRKAFFAGCNYPVGDGLTEADECDKFLSHLTPQPASPCPDCKAIHELILHSPGTDWQKTVHKIEAIVEKKFVPQPSDKLRSLVEAVKNDDPPASPNVAKPTEDIAKLMEALDDEQWTVELVMAERNAASGELQRMSDLAMKMRDIRREYRRFGGHPDSALQKLFTLIDSTTPTATKETQ